MAKKTGKTSGFNYSSRLVEVTQANLGIVCDDFVPGLKLVWLESLEMFMCFFWSVPNYVVLEIYTIHRTGLESCDF